MNHPALTASPARTNIVMVLLTTLALLILGAMVFPQAAHADGGGGGITIPANPGQGGGNTNPKPPVTPVNNPVNNNNSITYDAAIPIACIYGTPSTSGSADSIEKANGELQKYPYPGAADCHLATTDLGACMLPNGSRATHCNVNLICTKTPPKSATQGLLQTKHVITYKNGKKVDTTYRTRDCVYPPVEIKPTYTAGKYNGFCPVAIYEDLYWSGDASEIASGGNGTVEVNNATGYAYAAPAGSTGGGQYISSEATGANDQSVYRPNGMKVKTATYTLKKHYDNVAEYEGDCKPRNNIWNFKLPAADDGQGTKLGYYRQQSAGEFVACRVVTWPAGTPGRSTSVDCKTDDPTLFFKHQRFTNTCIGGLEGGIHTEDAKYFDGATCGHYFGVVCTAPKTLINNTPATTDSTTVVRNGKPIKVDFGVLNPHGEGIIRLYRDTIERRTSVSEGSTPYYPGSDDADYSSTNSNNVKQYFKLFKTNAGSDNTPVLFDRYYPVTSVGRTNYVQFYWASDSAAPWSITTKWKYTADFKGREMKTRQGSQFTVRLKDTDDTCTPSDSTNVNVVRSISSN